MANTKQSVYRGVPTIWHFNVPFQISYLYLRNGYMLLTRGLFRYVKYKFAF